MIPSGFFQCVYHIGCGFNLHSIINSGLILGGQNSSKRQTVFFLPIDPRDKGHQDPARIDFSVPRRAQYLHSAWKKHQDAVFWVDINLAIQKGLTFYQTRSNAIVLQGTLPAYCIPKVVRLKTGEVLYEKTYMSPRPPPKISLRHDHDWTRGNVQLGSTVEQQPHGKVVRQSRGEVQHATFSQPTQPNPKTICDRSGQPDNLSGNARVEQFHDRSGQLDERNSSSAHTVKEQHAPGVHEDNMSLNVEQTTDGTVRPVAILHTAAAQDDSRVCSAQKGDTLNVDDEVLRKRMEKSIAVHDENHEPMMVNEADMDFRIPGLPHSVVKYAQSTIVRKLIQKIENHPDRHALQRDLRQSQSFNPFSPESKQMIQDVGEHRIV